MPLHNRHEAGGVRSSVKSSEVEVIPLQVEQILDLLDQTVNKLEMVLCMPQLLENNAKHLRAFVTREELEIVRKIARYKCKPINFDEKELLNLLEPIEDRVVAKSEFMRERILRHRYSTKSIVSTITAPFSVLNLTDDEDFGVTKSVNVLFRNSMLLNFIKNDLLMHVSSAAKIFLHYIYQLQIKFRLKILTTPKRKYARVMKLCRAWDGYETTRMVLISLRKAVSEKYPKSECILARKKTPREKNAEFECILARKKAVLKRERDRVLEQQNLHLEQLEETMSNSEREMAVNWRLTGYQRQTLRENLENMKWNLDDIRRTNLLSEKQMRNKKFKVESQLRMIIAQYDNDMKELQNSIENAKEEMKLDREQLKELQSRFDEQEVIYEQMITQRDEEERRLFEERMYRFLVRRSARRILKFYRAYKARKLARKRKPKLASHTTKSVRSSSKVPKSKRSSSQVPKSKRSSSQVRKSKRSSSQVRKSDS